MKRLFLIRHAKSDWGDPSLEDIERPLNDRGKADVLLMGTIIKEKFALPDIMLSSPAKRARKTAKIIQEVIGFKGEIILIDRLYEFDVSSYYRAIEQLPNKANSAFLFGHNPVISDFAEDLIGEFVGDIPTCGVFVMDLEIDSWIHITSGCAKKIDYFYPKMLN